MGFWLSVKSRCIAGSFFQSVLLLGLVFSPLTDCRAVKPPDESRHLLDRLEHEILKEPLSGKAVYMLKEPLAGGTSVASWRESYRIPKEFGKTIFIFVDDQPGANWEHPCRYVFIDEATGNYRLIAGRTPPNRLGEMEKIF
jgi:hypothetical protein